MSETLCAVGVALVGALFAFILREMGFRASALIGALCAVGLFALATLGIGEIKDELAPHLASSGASELFGSALLAVGVAYLFSFAAELARALGEGTVASALELLGRVEIVVMAAPALAEILKMAEEIIKGG